MAKNLLKQHSRMKEFELQPSNIMYLTFTLQCFRGCIIISQKKTSIKYSFAE